MICFTRYAHKKSTKLFSLYYQVLIMGKKNKESESKNNLIVGSFVYSTSIYYYIIINPIQDGLFQGCSRIGRGQRGPPP